jgi:hypothetical protein
MKIYHRALGLSSESDSIVETTEISGLHWIRNYFINTSEYSRIILPSPGQGNFSVVYHGIDFAQEPHGGYEVYGIHVGQVDVLTFLACDNRVMFGHFVDCRKNSPTLHKDVTLAFKGNPDLALVIDPGIAHIFDNLYGMVTLNQMRFYIDIKNPDLNREFDVINVLRNTPPDQFPIVKTNRFRAPDILCSLIRRYQRDQIRRGIGTRHAFNLMAGDKKITLTPDKY